MFREGSLRTVRRTAIASVVALIALGGCSTGSSHPISPSAVTNEVATTLITTTTAPDPASTVAAGPSADPLERLLLASVPAGYVQQPDSVGDTGPSDLAKAVRDDGTPDAQTVLTQDGFVHGYQRLWQTPDHRQIVGFIYQFATASGATAYQQRSVSNARSDPQTPASPFSVSGIPGAEGLSANAGGTSTSLVLFTKGSYLLQLAVNGPSPTGSQALVQQLAVAQYGRL